MRIRPSGPGIAVLISSVIQVPLLLACAPHLMQGKTSVSSGSQSGAGSSWEQRVGLATLRDALSELGPPDATAQAGGIVVASWENARPVVVNTFGRTKVASQRVDKLVLTFDEATGVLQAVQRQRDRR